MKHSSYLAAVAACAVALLVAASAQALPKSIAECGATEDLRDRLDCYESYLPAMTPRNTKPSALRDCPFMGDEEARLACFDRYAARAKPVDAPRAQQSTIRALTPAEKNLLTKAFSSGLNDPESAKFKWLPINTASRDESGKLILYCGQVNSKNSDGEYEGFTPFYAGVAIDSNKIIYGTIIGIAQSRSGDVVVSRCAKAGYKAHTAQ